MASIENRSKVQVSIKNRDDLTKTFEYSADKAIKAYVEHLKAQGYKPKLASLNNHYAIRARQVGYPDQCLYASSEVEALELKQRIESERRRGIVIDYGLARRTTFADLLIRYLHEEAPRHKSFEVEGYKINAVLEDAGLPREDMAAILAAHPNPHPKWKGKQMRKPTGAQMREPSEASRFVRKSFADVVPDDFMDYIDERCQMVEASTVDREIDIFAAVCNTAIDMWRIPCAKSPMDGVRRPSYFNERDRRLKGDEETRLLEAAHQEDRARSIALRLEKLMQDEREDANEARTVYKRKKIVKAAREQYQDEAQQSYTHVALLETLIQFLLMTGARRSEALNLTWSRLDLETQTALLPESKNGRARKLSIRTDLVHLLRALPRTDHLVFPISVDGLRKAWARICSLAGLTGDNELRIHDLRHEAISRVAEAGSNTPGGFTLVDLQAFSGHRDTRMLLRYAHLCTQSLAKRLDAAFADSNQITAHHGVRRLKKGAAVTIGDLCGSTPLPPQPAPSPLNQSFTFKLPSVCLTWGANK
ncbi:site-specific integrase [Comamonas sp. w2-DMI]|uniref:site-specific integrase n=1 Tax=Comamonas sp. w2-DMI TaxID=3126391 RepID=UPI0032E3CA9F